MSSKSKTKNINKVKIKSNKKNIAKHHKLDNHKLNGNESDDISDNESNNESDNEGITIKVKKTTKNTKNTKNNIVDSDESFEDNNSSSDSDIEVSDSDDDNVSKHDTNSKELILAKIHNITPKDVGYKEMTNTQKTNSISDLMQNKKNISCNDCIEKEEHIKKLEKQLKSPSVYSDVNSPKVVIKSKFNYLRSTDIKSKDFKKLNKDYKTNDNKIKCWWCYGNCDVLYGLPTKYINNVFHIYGYFCSFSCIIAFNVKENTNNPEKVKEIYSLIHRKYELLFEKEMKLHPTSSPYTRVEFGGIVSNEEYFKNIKKQTKSYILLNDKIIPYNMNTEIKNYDDSDDENNKNKSTNIAITRSRHPLASAFQL